MQGKSILIIEDEVPIRDMVRFALERSEMVVAEAGDVQKARLQIAERRPDLILLDWMLPGTSGIEFLRELRGDTNLADIPVIMLTARAEEDDAVRGLNVGADDYVTKPFGAGELVARIQAVLRRTLPGGEDERIVIGALEVDAASQRVTIDDKPVKLGPTEYRLLHFFVSNAERVYTREQVLDRVWGQSVYVEERTVDVHIRRLRKALAPHSYDSHVQTVRGTGYRFSTKV